VWILNLVLSALIGALLSWAVTAYYYYKSEDENIARYSVAAMFHRCPVKDSRQYEARIGAYLDALARTKKDGRGVPVWREDCSIAVDWSLVVADTLSWKDRVR
jgi:hypothetical protein